MDDEGDKQTWPKRFADCVDSGVVSNCNVSRRQKSPILAPARWQDSSHFLGIRGGIENFLVFLSGFVSDCTLESREFAPGATAFRGARTF
jgi:hypothetical protein